MCVRACTEWKWNWNIYIYGNDRILLTVSIGSRSNFGAIRVNHFTFSTGCLPIWPSHIKFISPIHHSWAQQSENFLIYQWISKLLANKLLQWRPAVERWKLRVNVCSDFVYINRGRVVYRFDWHIDPEILWARKILHTDLWFSSVHIWRPSIK